MKNITTLAFVSLFSLDLVQGASIAYTYSYSNAPGVENGATDAYEDDGAGFLYTQTNTPFTSGDLNDGDLYTGGNPVADDPNSMIGWAGEASTITIDLGAAYDITSVDITSYAFPAFNVGRPVDVTISTSPDNISYSGSILHSLTDVSTEQSITRTDTGIRYIQLSFDGSSHSGDKWALNEIGVQAVPEPATSAFLALGLASLVFRRRK